MGKQSVLVLYNDIKNYRVEIWNIIAEHYNIDVAYPFKDESTTECRFKKIHYNTKKIGPIFTVPNSLKKTFKNYDVIVFMANLRHLGYCLVPFLPHKYKTVAWGIGFRVSYTRPYIVEREHTLLDKLYAKILNKADAMVFYMEKAKEFWYQDEIDFNKVFVAPNTVRVKEMRLNELGRNDFLFVGTLYQGKGLDKLIESYANVRQAVGVNNKLHIVGNGDQRENLEQQVCTLGLRDEVIFYGAIYDEDVLSELFIKSVLCISPTQAGLTVPKSLGYGTPFVCHKDAITGGEMYHVQDGVNGVIYSKDEDLFEIMKDAILNPAKYQKMCIAAKGYYDNKATPQHMAQGIINAIEYALRH